MSIKAFFSRFIYQFVMCLSLAGILGTLLYYKSHELVYEHKKDPASMQIRNQEANIAINSLITLINTAISFITNGIAISEQEINTAQSSQDLTRLKVANLSLYEDSFHDIANDFDKILHKDTSPLKNIALELKKDCASWIELFCLISDDYINNSLTNVKACANIVRLKRKIEKKYYELNNLVLDFVNFHSQFLTNDERLHYIMVLKQSFAKDIKKFDEVSKKNINDIKDLKFYDGGWPAVLAYSSLKQSLVANEVI